MADESVNAANTVDTLELVIQAKASEASKKVEELATSVETFGSKISRYVSDLSKFATSMTAIAEAAKALAGVKNVRDIFSNAANAASQAKRASVGKALGAASTTARYTKPVTGRTRDAMFDGRPVRYEKSADDIARGINRDFHTKTTNKEFSGAIQGARSSLAKGDYDAAMSALREVAVTISETATSKEGMETDLVQALNTYFRQIPVTKEQVAYLKGEFGSMKAANDFLWKAGVKAPFHTSKNSLDGLFENNNDENTPVEVHGEDLGALRRALAENGMENQAPIEDLVYALKGKSDGTHENWLKFQGGQSESQLAEQIYVGLLREVMTHTVVDTKSESGTGATAQTVAQATQDAEEASRIAKEMEAAWTAYEKQEAKASQSFYNKNPLDWDKWEASESVATEDIDNTAQEIEAWKAMEDQAEALAAAKAEAADTALAEQIERETEAAWALYEAEQAVVNVLDDKFWRGNPNQKIEDDLVPEGQASFNAFNLDAILKEASLEAREYGKAENLKDLYLVEAITRSARHREMGAPEFETLEGGEKGFQNLVMQAYNRDLIGKLDFSTRQYVDNYLADPGQIEAIDSEVQSADQSLQSMSGSAGEASSAMSDVGDSTSSATNEMRELRDAADDAKNNTKGIGSSLSALASTKLGNLTNQLMRVAKTRALRYFVRQISSGVSEGISNLYKWSSNVNGHFASSMDTAASKLMLMKNSIATALSPLIEMAVPYLSTFISWVYSASNAVSQFFAILNGQDSYTKAIETTEKWGDTTKKTSSAMKDLLADWDELNIIQSSSTGTGTTTDTNYKNMFTESTEFDEWTKKFQEIKTIVTAIGTGIAAWFVISEVESFIGKLGIAGDKVDGIFSTIRQGAVGAVLLTIGFSLASASGKDIATNGLNVSNIATSILSLVASGLGGYMLAGAAAKFLLPAALTGGASVIGAVLGVAIAVGFGIYSYVTTKNQEAYEAAKEWLLNTAFDYDVEAKLNIINTTVEGVQNARTAVQEKTTEMLGTIDSIKLGINDTDTLKTLKDQIGDENSGLIQALNTEASEAKALVKLHYTLVPQDGNTEGTGETGQSTSAEKYTAFANVWDDITGWYEQKGKELGRLFVENEKGEIEVSDVELAETIINQIQSATKLSERAQLNAELMVAVDTALSTGEDAKITEAFDDYKTKIAEAAENEYKETIIEYERGISMLEGIIASETDEDKINKYTEDLDKLKEDLSELTKEGGMQSYVDDYVTNMTTGATNKVKEYFSTKYAQTAFNDAFNELFEDTIWTSDVIERWLGDGTTAEELLEKKFEDNLAFLPKTIREFLTENGISIYDFLTDEQKAVIDEKVNPTIEESETEEVVSDLQKTLDENPAHIQIDPVLSDDDLEYETDTTYDDSASITGATAGSTSWYSGATGEQEMYIDTENSDMASDSTLQGIGTNVSEKMASLQAFAERAYTLLSDIAASSATTANKSWTVNIGASSALGGAVARSGGMVNKLTGTTSLVK